MTMITIDRSIQTELREKKHALVLATAFSVAPELTTAKEKLWADWENLELDNFLKDGDRFRKRRFGLFYLLPVTGEVFALPQTTYTQSGEINSYAGDVARTFAPLLEATQTNRFLHELIKCNFRQFPVDDMMAQQPWEIDVHQFRIVASEDEQGQPTPEGMHHDGDDFNCIHMIGRQNAQGGTSTVYDNERNPLTTHTLLNPMDSIMVWDPHVMHGVTPIYPKSSDSLAIRDVLVIGYNHRPNLQKPN